MSDEEPHAGEAIPLNMHRKRGRPRKDDSPMVGPLKEIKACDGQVVMRAYMDDRSRKSKEWAEVTPRSVGCELSAEEKMAFLRCVASLRRMSHAKTLAVRSSGGTFETPQPVILAGELMGISEVVAKRVHAEFQRSKVLPDGSGRGIFERAFVIQTLFGKTYLESWARLVVQRCIAVKKRPSYRDITEGMQELAKQQARDESSMIEEEVDEGFINNVTAALTYQRVRRWCRSNKWIFKKITKVKGIVSDNSATVAACTRYCRRFYAEVQNGNVVVIYLDESYCNEKHAKRFAVCKVDDQSTWSDEVKDGRRLCFCTAICEEGEISTLDSNRPADSRDSRWTFSPNKDQMNKKDYHASFDSQNFQTYFREALLPACERVFPHKRLVFVMDNAAYHVSASFEVQAEGRAVSVHRQSRKNLLVQFLQAHGQEAANMSMLRVELEALFVSVSEELGCDIARLLRARGHELLLTPPRVSVWQPIELYWASCKNEVAKLYRQGRGLVETKKQLDDSLTKWGTAAHCSKLIKHTTQLVATWWQAAQAADAQQDAPHAPEDHIEIHSDCISDDDEHSSHSD